MTVPGLARRLAERMQSRRAAWWLAGLLVLAASGAWLVLGSPVLAVREVEVTGSRIAGADQVRAVAAVRLGTPLARVDVAAVRARVRTLPWVADAEVSRAWPDTLLIEVSARVAVAAVAAGNQYLIVDTDGVVFGAEARRPPALALLRLAQPGPTDPATRAALRVLAALTPELRARLRVLVVESAVRIRLELSDGRTVIWGDAAASGVKARVASSLLSRPGRTIDVSAPDVASVR